MTIADPSTAEKRSFWRRLRDYPRSLAGRLTLVLSLGMALSAMLALQASDALRSHVFAKEQVEAALKSAVDIAHRYDREPEKTDAILAQALVLGAHRADASWHMAAPNPRFSSLLSEKLGRPAQVVPMTSRQCFSHFAHYPKAAGMNFDPLPECWYIRYRTSAGTERSFVVDLWPDRDLKHPAVGPPYLELIIVAGALLGLLAASLATAPLRRMERAARAFSLVGDFEPIPAKDRLRSVPR